MNKIDFEMPCPVEYRVSGWLHDYLPLRRGLTVRDGEVLEIPVDDIKKAMNCRGGIDFAFVLDENVFVAVSLLGRCIATYRYRTNPGLCDLYRAEDGEPWVDAACSLRNGRAVYELSSLFLLTKKNRIIKLSIHHGHYRPSFEYDVQIEQSQEYQRILVCAVPKSSSMGPTDATVYLWAPKKRMLQMFNLFRGGGRAESKAELNREVRVKRPKLLQDGQMTEFDYDPHALTVYMDEQSHSVLCADRSNHILFECFLNYSESRLLCGQGIPGRSGENVETPAALLSAPCAPLVVRPWEYIDINMFDVGTKDLIKATKDGALPRVVLVCDGGNRAVRKIWQFPDHNMAQDLANLNRFYTLLGYDAERGGPGAELLNIRCGRPKALFVGENGQLAVTTDKTVYVLISGNVQAEENCVKGKLSSDS